MAEGEPPYSEYKTWVAMKEIQINPPKGLKDPSRWSESFNDFVKKCLTVNPSERPSAEELLKHPFLQMGAKFMKLPKKLVDDSKDLIQFQRDGKVKEMIRREKENENQSRIDNSNNTIIIHENNE